VRRRPSTRRRLTAAALAAGPLVVALAVPASAAAAVTVTPAPEGCGVVVALAGLGEGTRTAAVRTTAVSSDEPVPVVPATVASPGPVEPQLTAVQTVSGDAQIVVVLDAGAVPDADPRVTVVVTVDEQALASVELALPGCGAGATVPVAVPPATPTAQPSTGPAAAPTTPPVTPLETASPSTTGAPTTPSASAEPSPTGEAGSPAAPASPTTSPSASQTPAAAGPSATATPSASPSAPPPPTANAVTPTPSVTASPVLVDAPDTGTGGVDDLEALAYGGVTGWEGSLSLMSFAAAPQLDAGQGAAPVPAPVIAAPDGAAAGVLPAPEGSSRLSDLLPQAPEGDGDETAPAQLAAPDLAAEPAADPLVDLAPAAFVLSASLGGLLMAGRRRPS